MSNTQAGGASVPRKPKTICPVCLGPSARFISNGPARCADLIAAIGRGNNTHASRLPQKSRSLLDVFRLDPDLVRVIAKFSPPSPSPYDKSSAPRNQPTTDHRSSSPHAIASRNPTKTLAPASSTSNPGPNHTARTLRRSRRLPQRNQRNSPAQTPSRPKDSKTTLLGFLSRMACFAPTAPTADRFVEFLRGQFPGDPRTN